MAGMKLWLVTESLMYNQSTLQEEEPLLIIRALTEADAIAMAEKKSWTRYSSSSFVATELSPEGSAQVIYCIRGWEYSED